jgi:hypothetical protein
MYQAEVNDAQTLEGVGGRSGNELSTFNKQFESVSASAQATASSAQEKKSQHSSSSKRSL